MRAVRVLMALECEGMRIEVLFHNACVDSGLFLGHLRQPQRVAVGALHIDACSPELGNKTLLLGEPTCLDVVLHFCSFLCGGKRKTVTAHGCVALW